MCPSRSAALVLATIAAAPCGSLPAQDAPTNVVFLLVDDWGWRDAGCFGSDLYETPAIDRLAAHGTRFTDAYAACTVCSPTRAAVMTGKYPARIRVTDWIPGHRREDAPLRPPDWTQRLEHRHVTIAEALRAAGYRTAHVGKWHLTPRSDNPEVVEPYYPQHHGFDVNVAGNQWGAPGSHHWPFTRDGAPGEGLAARVANFPAGGEEGDYLTDTLTDHATRFIEDSGERPFFLYFAWYAVHTPIQGRADLVARYEAKLDDGAERQHGDAGYAAMVTAVDESVGRIVAALERTGVTGRTVIVLTGDNGGLDRDGHPTENHPLRAGKGSAYEGGVRVPCVILAPGVGRPGSVSDEPVVTVDFYPTILELTGVSAPPDADLDGVSLVPVLEDPTAELERDAIFWHYPHYHPGGATPHSAVRMRDWKLIEFQHDGRAELYHLAEDVGETRDLAAAEPEQTRELRARLHAWRERVNAQPARPSRDQGR